MNDLPEPPAAENPRASLENVLKGLEELNPVEGMSFRGWLPDPAQPPHTLVTRLITATSYDPVVATANWTTGQLAIFAGRSGRPVFAFSRMREAQEVAFLPSTMFHAHEATTIDGLHVRIYEEYTPTDTGFTTMNLDPAQVLATARRAIESRRNAALTIPPRLLRPLHHPARIDPNQMSTVPPRTTSPGPTPRQTVTDA